MLIMDDGVILACYVLVVTFIFIVPCSIENVSKQLRNIQGIEQGLT